MKYKAFISYEYYDSIEIEADNYDEAQRIADEYIGNSSHYMCDYIDVEVNEVEDE